MPSALPLLLLFISSSFCLLRSPPHYAASLSCSVSLLMQQNKNPHTSFIHSDPEQCPAAATHRGAQAESEEYDGGPADSIQELQPQSAQQRLVSHSELYETHTGWHIVCIMQAHALSPIHQPQLTLPKCCESCNTHALYFKCQRSISADDLAFLECLCCAFHLISLRASCSTQGRYWISESALKGSVHLSSWLTLSVHSVFLSPTHTHFLFAACSVWYSLPRLLL